MKQYLNIVRRVLHKGIKKHPVRVDEAGKAIPVENETIGLPNVVFSHDMSKGFPLLTTKKVAWKAVRVELEGFIRGITSKKWYQDRGCKIWNEWANPQASYEHWEKHYKDETNRLDDYDVSGYYENKKEIQKSIDDLGPIYGYQWRRFNQCYDENDDGWADEALRDSADQLKSIANKLCENPMDRRMVCSAWNPLQISRMALPPCHLMWGVVVYGDTLNLWWTQRSCDLMLGVPFNIASYGLLLCLLARHANLKVGNLTGTLCDCHIYLNQVEAAKEQITRQPRKLPFIQFRNKSGKLEKKFDIFDWTYEDVDLIDYNPHDKIDFGDVTV
jgi:thymidylate synthase